jgi:nucleotide-binding universal stress UspA family protein
MAAPKHILVPTDFGDAAEQAIQLAIELARVYDARLTVLHVCAVTIPPYAEALAWPIVDLEHEARTALDDLVARTKARWPNTECELCIGVPWDEILEAARVRNADLIVLGTHGRTWMSRLVLGSVADKIVRLSPIPVLTVPGPRHEKSASKPSKHESPALAGGR